VGTEIAKKYSRYAAKKHNLDLNEVVSGKVNDQSKLSGEAIVINNWLGSSFREYKKSKNKNEGKANVMDGLRIIKTFVDSKNTTAADKKAILDKIHLIQKGTLFSGFNSGGYRAMKKNDNDMYSLIRQIKDAIKQSA
jgi:DNA-directed RNA polymerase subunit N (RpoN/RPB10)